MKKNLYVHGSFMNDNYGDFLLYYVVYKECEKFKNKVKIFSSDVDNSYDGYCRVNRKSKFINIFSSDLVIFGGGGYFGEPNKLRILWNIRCLIKHLIPAYIISKRNVPFALIGVETGPLSFKISRFIMKKVCEKAMIVSVRNQESKIFLEQIGVTKQVYMIPDLIIGMNEKDLLKDEKGRERAFQICKKLGDYQKLVLIHITSSDENEGVRNAVSDLVKYSEENKDVKFIVICDQDRDSQKERARKIANNFKNGILVAEYEGPFVLSNLINNCDAVITDKLHVGIVATKLKKEVISLAAHPKSKRFYSLIHRENYCKMLNDYKPGDLYNKMKKLTFKEIIVDKKIFKGAEMNYELMDEFFEKNLVREREYE